MSTRYLILRADAPLDDSMDTASPAAWRRTRSGHGPSDLSIELEDGHERDAGELRADPSNAAVMEADAVFSLVKPKTRKAATAVDLDCAFKTLGSQRMPNGLVAVGAHATNFTGQGSRVAVLDTGLDKTHPAFAGKEIVSRDFTGQGSSEEDVTDLDGHGTHCTGTICGAPVDGVRVGVAPGVTRLAVGRVLGPSGGSLDMLLRGMVWAVLDQKSDIVSMSLGYDLPGNVARLVEKGVEPALAGQAAMELQNDIITGVRTLRAFLLSRATNVVFLAATGNESARPGFVLGAGLPAAELFSVGAVGPKGDKWTVADFSNGRARCVAPGVDVVSAAVGGGWATMSGTSMATPHAAGVAALWVEQLRNKGSLGLPEVVRAELLASATRRPLIDTDPGAVGAGLVQAPIH